MLLALGTLVGAGVQAEQPGDGLRNPVPYSKESIARGKAVYLPNCQLCHEEDGRARGSAIAVAADLTDPDRWKYGTSDGQIFSTIKNGGGDNMPPFKGDLKDQEIWDLVNFIRNIGPESKRPQP